MGYRYRVFAVGPDNEFIAEWLEAEKPSVIVNLAAQGEGAASYKSRNWKYFYRTNVVALAELSEMLLDKQWLKRFVQVGTSEVYGSVDAAATEEASLRPSSVYATSKLAFDFHVQSLAQHWGFPGLVVRPSNCMTPGQQLHRVVPKTFLLAMTGRRLALHGGGMARKSYMSADDLSSAITLLAERGVSGEIYNAGPKETVSIRHLVTLCARAMKSPLEEIATAAPDRTGQDACYWIDSSKLRALGWTPRVSLEEAVEQVHAWVRVHLPELSGLPSDYEMRA